MNNSGVKCLRLIRFSQLTLAWKTEIKNLGHATTGLVISMPSTRIHTYVRTLNPLVHAKQK
jgi:hypothetical protein